MGSRRNCLFITLFIANFWCLLHAQIPDTLKQPYWDLVKLNNTRQYQAAILQGKILVAQEPSRAIPN